MRLAIGLLVGAFGFLLAAAGSVVWLLTGRGAIAFLIGVGFAVSAGIILMSRHFIPHEKAEVVAKVVMLCLGAGFLLTGLVVAIFGGIVPAALVSLVGVAAVAVGWIIHLNR